MPEFDSKDGIGQFLWLPKSMKNGSIANNSEMKLPTHTGTHVDAPGHVFDHYFDAGFDVDTLDLEILNGHFSFIIPFFFVFFSFIAYNQKSVTLSHMLWLVLVVETKSEMEWIET